MLFGLIFSILSVQYTVATSSSVTISGEAPTNSEAAYSKSGSTGQVGQMTAGNSTTLVLSGWDGITIDSVTLEMHSNKSAGAGSMTMQIGEETVCSISDANFSHKTWHGSYTNQWVMISRWIGEKVPTDAPITIYIEASKNSLYIKSYTIYYTLPEPEAYSVSYTTGIGLKIPDSSEEKPLSGVLLPSCPDTLHWQFIGWSEAEVLESDTCPRVWLAGDRYYPTEDSHLWAVYSDGTEQEAITANFQTGDYVLANLFFARAMKGSVKNGMINTSPIIVEVTDERPVLMSGNTEAMIYRVTFYQDSTLTIQHQGNNQWIGYNEQELSGAEKRWQYRVLKDGSLCVHHDKGMLYWGYGSNAQQPEVVAYNAKVDWTLMQSDGIVLFPAKYTVFTTWPLGKIDGVENVVLPDFIGDSEEHIIHLGNYELHIQNGKKWLRLR